MISEVLAKVIATEIFKQTFSETLSYLKKASSKFKHMKPDATHAYRKGLSIEYVKTIWQVDKSVNLNNFYYPSKLIVDGKVVNISSIKDFPGEIKVVVQGTAGQGKSIFLRYLAGKELKEGHRIPIFVELRKISDKKSLEDLILDSLDEIGISIDAGGLKYIFESQKFSLLLDAFDEIPEKHIKDTLTFLEPISSKYHFLQIIVTSRAQSEVQKLAQFRILKLAPIGKLDFRPILNKFFSGNTKEVDNIMSSIHKSGSNISGLITTPLLLTLLTITYKGANKIPENANEFYEDIFSLLANRHDSTKPGFIRKYSSGLNVNQLETLFHAYCFYCMLSQKVSLTRAEAYEKIRKAVKSSEVSPSSEQNFLSDCTKNTCLIIEEGGEYHFLHKSIREYHAARYIKLQDERFKEKFYAEALINTSKCYAELSYLETIDKAFFEKHVLIPEVESFLKYFNWNGYEALNVVPLASAIKFQYRKDGAGKLQTNGFSYSEGTPLSYFSAKHSKLSRSIFSLQDEAMNSDKYKYEISEHKLLIISIAKHPELIKKLKDIINIECKKNELILSTLKEKCQDRCSSIDDIFFE